MVTTKNDMNINVCNEGVVLSYCIPYSSKFMLSLVENARQTHWPKKQFKFSISIFVSFKPKKKNDICTLFLSFLRQKEVSFTFSVETIKG
jgi:hypothetical protein